MTLQSQFLIEIPNMNGTPKPRLWLLGNPLSANLEYLQPFAELSNEYTDTQDC
jgi:hypothetical protein